MIIKNKQYSALILGVIVIACVWTVHFFGVFEVSNGLAYDSLMRYCVNTSESKQLLVIEGDNSSAQKGDELWIPLLKNLLAEDVKQVVFSFLPENVSADFYQLAADSGKVVFGQQVQRSDPYAPAKLQTLPLAAQGKAVAVGLVQPPTSQSGIFRIQNRNLHINGQILPTLEYVASQKVFGEITTATATDFRINFIGGCAKIPKVSLTQAVEGQLISELMAERTVLVGVFGLEAFASYFTPLSTASEQTSDILFHAFALDTLLSRGAIEELSTGLLLLLIFSITVVTIIYCQALRFRAAFAVSMLLTMCYVLGCWLILHQLFLWLPLYELILTQWLSFFAVQRYRVAEESRALDSTLFNLSINLQEKAFPVSFYHSQDPWEQLITMINESLNLKRMIFLERVPGDHRLKEVKAFQCSIDDVIEPRRDYERVPYSTVIREHRTLLLDKPYLKVISSDEQQFLAPLIFAGDVLGFWAFTLDSSVIHLSPKFFGLVDAYMTQISEILFYRQEWLQRMAQENNKIWRYLSFSTGIKSYQTLNQSVELLDRRIIELQQVFNNLNTGGVLYDLFGRVLLLNKYMEDLALSVNLKLYTMTALDFIIAVTGFDAGNARDIMQKTIFDNEAVSIPIANFKEGRDYIFHIKPLKLQNNKQFAKDAAQVFKITGILCELEDVTELKAIYRLKERMFERFSFQIRNDLTALVFAMSIIEDKSSGREEKVFALKSIQSKINESMKTLETVHGQMNMEIESLASGLGCYPIDGQEAIKKAVAKLGDYAALRSIKLHLQCPGLLSLVFASPTELAVVFHTLLSTLIDDAFEGADVWINIEEQPEWVHYFFRNDGIGIANNKLKYSEETRQLSTERLKMEEVMGFVEHWEGQIYFFSKIGETTGISLLLKRFL